jgi:transposase
MRTLKCYDGAQEVEMMSTPVPLLLEAETRALLDRIVASPTAQVRQVLRARIVLLAAAGWSNPRIAAELRCNLNTARLWRNRFLAQGLAGLRDVPGRGRKPQIVGEREAAIVAATLTPPEHSTHWSARRLAAKLQVSKSAVHRVWQTYGLQPHREKSFKFSRDPLLVEKVLDVIGLYLNPPDHALVLCVDEKSQIQALERTQPTLPLGPGKPACRTHDYLRHGTASLFAALTYPQGEVLGACAARHRHQEFLSFLRLIDRTYPTGEIHLILDNYGTHKHEQVQRWFARRPRYQLHFTPTSASWLNLVELFFSILTRQRVRRGSFTSLQALYKALHDYLRDWNEHPQPFSWTKTPEQILAPYNIAISGTEH